MTTEIRAALFALTALVIGLIMASLTVVVVLIATHRRIPTNEQQVHATYTYKPGTVVYV
ncbi:hypothetical protein [Mycobacterium intracellulare]|uniref:hypothetical protein n=1 Tax=Mycobacterium intracellulare TaxID=1767 RepID=UPI0015CE03E1|nr:hypothetical protein [Mycobacterium intracellulare]